MTDLVNKYQRIAPFYDILDLPFERRRYRHLRQALFTGLTGRILDAGVGTGRNMPFYPPSATVIGLDSSAAMLARAERRRKTSAAPVLLLQADATRLGIADRTFDAAVASFLFCVLPDDLQLPGLVELRRVVKRGGTIRLLEYVRPANPTRRFITELWKPWIAWAYGASFDRRTEEYVPQAGFTSFESRFVFADLIKLISARVP
jgi:ubiquinone/menaquinone biosynthesis C-methylase UbiE